MPRSLNLRRARVLTKVALIVAALVQGTEDASVAAAGTSTPWRDDVANLEATRLINEAYTKMPFSREFEGVLDQTPVRIDWEIGPNLPVCWKGGVAGLIGNDIVLTGGLWMPQRANLAYAFNIATETYSEIPAPTGSLPLRGCTTAGGSTVSAASLPMDSTRTPRMFCRSEP